MANDLGRPKLKLGDIVGGHTYMGGDPNSQSSWVSSDDYASSGKSGKDLLDLIQKNNPGLVPTIKALSEGRQQFPSGRMGTDNYWGTAAKLAQQYDPTFDATNYQTRQKTANDFRAGGTAAQNIRNLNQAIGHLYDMMKAVPGVAGQGGTLMSGLFGLAHPLNWARNTIEDASGDPRITAYQAPRTALASELASVFKGKGTSNEAEVNKLYDLLSINNSTPQKYQAGRSLSSLLKSRLDELQDQYAQGFNTTKDDLRFLNPQTVQEFKQIQNLNDKLQGIGVERPTGAPSPASVDAETSALLNKYGVKGY